MKTILFFVMCAAVLVFILWRMRRPPSGSRGQVDVIVPAFNEEPCLEQTLRNLHANKYVHRVICVNDGSTDGTGAALDRWAKAAPKLVVVHQANTGKGGAVMNGLQHVTTPYVFLTDADTYVPATGDDLGHLLAELEAGADAVGGVPSSDLRGLGWLGYIRATVKLPMIILKRTFQQLLGGAPFIISGACGMFRTDVLRKVGLSDRTKVEDLDLTWELVGRGYSVRQVNRCVVYPQECKTIREDWRRWRRWIMGYAVCMRLHRKLLLTRFGLFSILPMFLLVIAGVAIHAVAWTQAVMSGAPESIPVLLFPPIWVAAVCAIGLISALHHGKARLMFLAPLAVLYVLLSYAVWIIHGLGALFTGRELGRDKPTRYSRVVA
ncbi:MAG: glycosyltransferase family 2 protein [Pseudomonadota bacterium]|nr:glycosyltransferase family 2 protein [Pseudomonadota bacterium]